MMPIDSLAISNEFATPVSATPLHTQRAEEASDTLSVIYGPSTEKWWEEIKPTDSVAPIIAMLETPAIESSWTPAPEVPANWQTGLVGEPRTVNIGDNSGVLAIISLIFLLMMLSFSHCKRLIGQLAQELWSLRDRQNAFDERTSGESRTMLLMAVQWCVCTGLLIYSAISIYGPNNPPLPQQALADTSKLICLCAGYYVFQLAMYSLLGYVFSSSMGRVQLVQGFSASQSLLGFLLLIPALVSIFYPAFCSEAVWTGLVLYVLARIVFIVKGFRIFYVNFGSLLYFILYLCTLEIVPVILMAIIAIRLV